MAAANLALVSSMVVLSLAAMVMAVDINVKVDVNLNNPSATGPKTNMMKVDGTLLCLNPSNMGAIEGAIVALQCKEKITGRLLSVKAQTDKNGALALTIKVLPREKTFECQTLVLHLPKSTKCSKLAVIKLKDASTPVTAPTADVKVTLNGTLKVAAQINVALNAIDV